MRYRWSWITEEHSAASLWIPPKGSEMAAEDEARVPQLIEGLCGDRSAAVMELLGRFESARPRAPHYCLSLLGTDPGQRGRRLGMALLADNLARIDDTGMPAYRESSNPANGARYERVGFRRIGEFTTREGKHAVAIMWRNAR